MKSDLTTRSLKFIENHHNTKTPTPRSIDQRNLLKQIVKLQTNSKYINQAKH